MKFYFFRTIRSHLLLLVLISVLPALAIIIYSGVDRSFRDIEEAKSDALQVVKNFSFDHERVVESTRQFLMTLAKIPEIQNLNVPASNRLLSELLKQNPQYGTLFVVNAQGILHSSGTPLPPTPLSCKTRKYFRDAVIKKDFSVGEYGICPVVKHPVIEFSYPIIAAEDQFKGVVVVSLDLARFAQMLPMEKIPEGSTLSFGDHKGNLLYHYPNIKENVTKVDLPDMIKNMSAQPDEGVFTYTGVKGIKRLYTYRKFRMKAKEPPYLFIRVGIPEEKALFRARRAMAVNLVLLGVAFIIAVFSAFFFGNAIIVRRLKRLVDTSRRLGHGDLKTRTGLPYKRDELGALAKVFDEMAETLETKNAEREQAEEKIRKVADEWQTTFNAITDLVMILNNDCRIVRANKETVHFFNLPMDCIVGEYCYTLMHGVNKPPEQCLPIKMMKTKRHEEKEYYNAEKDIWLFLSADPILDNKGDIAGLVLIIKDITNRKRAEEALRESENKFRDLVEKSSVGVYIVQDGIFKYANEKVAEQSGCLVEELIDKMGPKDVVLPEDWPIVEENIKKRLSNEGVILEYDFRERTKDNKIINVEVRGSHTMYHGRPAVIGTSIDITDRKRAEEALRESENKFRDLVEKSNVGVYLIQDGVDKYVNARCAEIHGYSVEEMIDKIGPKDTTFPEDWPCIEENIRKRMSGELESLHNEFRIVTENQEIRNVEIYGSRTIYKGRPAVIGTMLDITDRKRSEEALKESENKFRDLAEKSPVGVYIVQDGVFKYANEKIAERTGHAVEELINKMGPRDFVLPGDWPMVEEKIRKRLSGEVGSLHYEFRERTKSNEIINVEAHGSRTMYRGRPAVIGTSTDITDRKRAEEALRESEEKFRDLTEKSLVGIYIIQDGVFKYANAKVAEQIGYSVEELINKMSPKDFLLPEDWPIAVENTRKRLSGEVESLQYEFRQRTKDNRIINVEVHGSRTMYQGRPALIGTSIDITDRKRAEEALRESEEKFRDLAEKSPVGVYIIQDDVFKYVNSKNAEIHGYTVEELIDKKGPRDLVFPEDWPLLEKSYQKKLSGGVDSLPYELRGITKNSRIINVEVHGSRTMYRGRPAVIGTLSDVTGRRRAEEKLRESEEVFRQLAENIRDVFYMYEQDITQPSYISPAYMEVWGRPCQSPYQESLWDAVHPEDKDRVMRSLEKKSRGEVEEVYRIVRPDGSIRWIRDRSFPIYDDSGKTRRVVGIAADITDLKLGEERLKYLSLHDPLTGLYNRIYFEEEMSRIEKARYDTVGIVSCDVDGLKLVNDTLGHDQGDHLLVTASRVIRDSFREGDLVARIGGDEFSVVLPNTTEAAVEHACQRIQEAITSYNAANPELPLSISVGFAVSNGVYRNAKDLFKEADNSMYQKKLYRTLSVRNTIVKTLITTLRARDLTTEKHVIRLEKLLANMTAFIGLPESTISDLSLLARFHDIGKVGISDTILFKEGSLTFEEWSEMKRHCEIGYRMALSAPELVPIADWILKHHEWWNGQGYPLGIQGEEIPIECRLLGITEAYEAMTSVRPYRRAFSHGEAVAELLRHSGTQFDPQLLERFIQMLETHPPESGSDATSAV